MHLGLDWGDVMTWKKAALDGTPQAPHPFPPTASWRSCSLSPLNHRSLRPPCPSFPTPSPPMRAPPPRVPFWPAGLRCKHVHFRLMLVCIPVGCNWTVHLTGPPRHMVPVFNREPFTGFESFKAGKSGMKWPVKPRENSWPRCPNQTTQQLGGTVTRRFLTALFPGSWGCQHRLPTFLPYSQFYSKSVGINWGSYASKHGIASVRTIRDSLQNWLLQSLIQECHLTHSVKRYLSPKWKDGTSDRIPVTPSSQSEVRQGWRNWEYWSSL